MQQHNHDVYIRSFAHQLIARYGVASLRAEPLPVERDGISMVTSPAQVYLCIDREDGLRLRSALVGGGAEPKPVIA